MLLIDDILLLPLRGLSWVFQEIHKAAQEETCKESEAITGELTELYMLLQTGQIAEAEFEAREKVLLDRLEQIQEREGPE